MEIFPDECPESFFSYENQEYSGSLWHSYQRIRKEYKQYGVIKSFKTNYRRRNLGMWFKVYDKHIKSNDLYIIF